MITSSASYFVPKPFTPFQWAPMIRPEEFTRRAYAVKDACNRMHNKKSIRFIYHDADISILEGVFARGDRKLSQVIMKAYEKGAIYDAWSEYFKPGIYEEAFNECGIDPYFYTERTRPDDEVFPWDHIDVGVTREFLLREWKTALSGKKSSNCRQQCLGCGAASYGVGVCFKERT